MAAQPVEPSAPIIARFLAGYRSGLLQRALEHHEEQLVREALELFLLDEQMLHEDSLVSGLRAFPSGGDPVGSLVGSAQGWDEMAAHTRALACRLIRAEQAVLMMREHLTMLSHHADTRRGSS